MEHHRGHDAREIRPGIWRHSHRHDPITTPERDAHEHEHVRGSAAEVVAVSDHLDPVRVRGTDPDDDLDRDLDTIDNIATHYSHDTARTQFPTPSP